MTYIAVYIYCVPKKALNKFMEIHRKVAMIIGELGGDSVMYKSSDLRAKYGCGSLRDLINPREQDVIFFGVDSFRSREDYKDIMKKFDGFPKVNKLYNQVVRILDIKEIKRGELEQII